MIQLPLHKSINRDKKTPPLRFINFDDNWVETTIGNEYEFHRTNSFSRDQLNYESGHLRNIHYGDIHTKFQTHFKLQNEDVPFVNIDVDLKGIKKEHFCVPGDLVIADASEDYEKIGATIEIIDLNSEDIVAGLHTYLGRPKNGNIVVGFASLLMQSWTVRKQVMILAQGTKVFGISTGNLSQVLFKLPSLPEQQKIASFLSAVDKKIEQLTRKKELLEQYKKGVMQKLFPPAGGQARPGEKHPELRFKDEHGNDFPDWEVTTFGEIARFINGKAYKQAELLDEGKYQVLRVGNLFSNNDWYYSDLELKEDKYIDQGDLIYAWSASFGPFYWEGDKAIYHYHIWKVEPFESVAKYFLYYLFEYDKDKILSESQGATMFHITKGNMESREIFVPSKKEQLKISKFIQKIDRKIKLALEELEKAQTFKKGLLQQMFV